MERAPGVDVKIHATKPVGECFLPRMDTKKKQRWTQMIRLPLHHLYKSASIYGYSSFLFRFVFIRVHSWFIPAFSDLGSGGNICDNYEMPSKLLPAWSKIAKPVIGMLHVPALPGSPRYTGDVDAIREIVLRDASALVTGGVHALMMENFGDIPFYPGLVPTHVIAHMTAIAAEVRRRFDIPLGINVLRNDGCAALSIAHAVGAHFIRVNVLCGARVTDQGVIQGIAHDLLRLRANLQANEIRIFADVDVKHSAPLAQRPIADEVDDTLERGLADALVVSGAGTGKHTELAKVKAVKTAAGDVSVFIGSGITAETIVDYESDADGFIIGTAFKEGGIATNPVDPIRVQALFHRLR
jgi:hypothetical protein